RSETSRSNSRRGTASSSMQTCPTSTRAGARTRRAVSTSSRTPAADGASPHLIHMKPSHDAANASVAQRCESLLAPHNVSLRGPAQRARLALGVLLGLIEFSPALAAAAEPAADPTAKP